MLLLFRSFLFTIPSGKKFPADSLLGDPVTVISSLVERTLCHRARRYVGRSPSSRVRLLSTRLQDSSPYDLRQFLTVPQVSPTS